MPAIIIEIQHGYYLGENDIVRRQDDYGRVVTASAGQRAPRVRRSRHLPA